MVNGKHISLELLSTFTIGVKTKLDELLNNKVDKVLGKQLSTEDYTTEEKQKLAGLENYIHPANDGNKHVPANGTNNAGKVLTASAEAGVYTWEELPSSDNNKVYGLTFYDTQDNFVNGLFDRLEEIVSEINIGSSNYATFQAKFTENIIDSNGNAKKNIILTSNDNINVVNDSVTVYFSPYVIINVFYSFEMYEISFTDTQSESYSIFMYKNGDAVAGTVAKTSVTQNDIYKFVKIDDVYPIGVVVELTQDLTPSELFGGDWWDITSKYSGIPSNIKKWQRILKVDSNKTQLQKTYDQYKDLKQEDYTEASWPQFAEALAKAKEVLENPGADQDTVDQTYSALVSAYLDLKKKPS